MRKLKLKEPQLSEEDFDRRADEFLKAVQAKLLPDHAKEVVAINMVTGEYVLGQDSTEASDAFRARWPNVLQFVCRVDGSASTSFYGK